MQGLPESHIFKSLYLTFKIQFLVEIMLNQIETLQSLCLAKERDTLWLQNAETCIKSAEKHKITFGLHIHFTVSNFS